MSFFKNDPKNGKPKLALKTTMKVKLIFIIQIYMKLKRKQFIFDTII